MFIRLDDLTYSLKLKHNMTVILWIQYIDPVSRLSHRPVFDCLEIQYAQTEEREPGPFYHVVDLDVYVQEREVNPDWNNKLEGFKILVVSVQALKYSSW